MTKRTEKFNGKLNLNGTWKLLDFEPGAGQQDGAHLANYDDTLWLQANVPGDVHSSLLTLGKIPDPFYEANIEQVQWVEKREWWYRTRFPAMPPLNKHQRFYLTFDGLDLFATIYLNGHKVAEHANMFRPAEILINDNLFSDQENVLAVRFDALRNRIGNQTTPLVWDQFDGAARSIVRKTQAQFGWDHTPACLNVGIWQDVHIKQYQHARLHLPHFRVLSLDPNQAVVSIDTEVEVWGSVDELELQISLDLQSSFSHLARHVNQSFTTTVSIRNGVGRTIITVPEPVLWWSTGLGEAALYDLQVNLVSKGQILDKYASEVGLRTVTVDRTPDSMEVGNESFTFVLNDVPVFIKGANWVPPDLLNGRVTTTDYDEWVKLLKEANGNMLRVWGGGQYERDAFYRAANRNGILIWQDFMFACATYPAHVPSFVEEVRKEAEFQVKRLRNYPCLAIWVGNNEIDWLLDQVFWDEPGKAFPGKMIGHDLLPSIVRQFDRDRFYWQSSPYGGDDHNSDHAGDKHNWQTWHGIGSRKFGEFRSITPPGTLSDSNSANETLKTPIITAKQISYRHLGTDMGRFISEYGIHAAPVLETFRRNIANEHLRYLDPSVKFRDRNQSPGRGEMMMQAHVSTPETLEEYIDFSMMVQAEGLKYGIEHHRRRKFHCSGTLFWQWNDNWPGISWSVLDYYRFPKAGYFFTKRAFAPVMVSIREEPEGNYKVWGCNDTLSPISDVLHVYQLSFEGQIIKHIEQPITIPENASVSLMSLDRETFNNLQPNTEMLWVRSGQGLFPDNRYFLVELRDLVRRRPELNTQWSLVSKDRIKVKLHSKEHAYFVNFFIPVQGIRYSDNWIDLFPNQETEIEIWHPEGQPITPEMVTVRWH